jgi:MinD superfamily P-loop ATPase|tara:strand:- start:4 stop:228 length:225 start_codon:yes stop_codon:yes gene_type:complete
MQFELLVNTFDNNNHREIENVIEDHDFDMFGSIPYVEIIKDGDYYILADSYEDVYIFSDILDHLGINYTLREVY